MVAGKVDNMRNCMKHKLKEERQAKPAKAKRICDHRSRCGWQIMISSAQGVD